MRRATAELVTSTFTTCDTPFPVAVTVGLPTPLSRATSATDDFERKQILAALSGAGGIRVRAAAHLGLSSRGLAKKMQRLGMS